MSRLLITPRDEAVVNDLLFKVRSADTETIATARWPNTSVHTATRRLARLEKESGYLQRFETMAYAVPTVDVPAHYWEPGLPEPSKADFERLSYAFRRRWRDPRPRVVWAATRFAADHFGGCPGGVKNLAQASHDLHLAAIYFHKVVHAPRQAADWVGEDVYPDRPTAGIKTPDARLCSNAETYLVVESAGAYSANRIRAFHLFCRDQSISYELW